MEFLKFQITNAVLNGGGWIVMNFHEFCDGCSTIGIDLNIIRAFFGWLNDPTNEFSSKVKVKRIKDVIGGDLQGIPGIYNTTLIDPKIGLDHKRFVVGMSALGGLIFLVAAFLMSSKCHTSYKNKRRFK